MQKQSAIAFGTMLVVLEIVGAVPAQAARLQVSFTTEGGGAGSFILNTDTASVPESELPPFFTIREGNRAYLNAVSNFSFSSPYLSFDHLDADYGVFPSVEFGSLLGIPERAGAYTAVYAPAGCLFDPAEFCPTEFPIAYTGNLSTLPDLSDNPDAYSGGFDIARVDPTGVLSSDPLTSFSVKPVPEPDSVFSTLVFGIASLGGLLLKRKISQSKL